MVERAYNFKDQYENNYLDLKISITGVSIWKPPMILLKANCTYWGMLVVSRMLKLKNVIFGHKSEACKYEKIYLIYHT